MLLATSSLLGPFRHPIFATIWSATVVSQIGGWMYSAASAWLMTELDATPSMVALVQFASTLPIFLFAIPAGAVSDMVDKRSFLIVGEVSITVTATLFAAVVTLGWATPVNVLVLTFLCSTAVALTAPAWQSVVPQLVPRQDLRAAIAANSIGMNASRAIGPALGGVMISSMGLPVPFWVNALSNVGVLEALRRWQSSSPPTHRTAQTLADAIGAGLLHACQNVRLRATLVRSVAFFFFASAYWALLPALTRQQIEGGASLYGLLLAVIGAAAVGGAFLLKSLNELLGTHCLVAASSGATALALGLFALAHHWAVALLASVVAGASWIAAVASLNVSAQTALVDWVRARGLAVFISVFFGSLSLGSIVWGAVADQWGLPIAHFTAAAGLLGGVVLTLRWNLNFEVRPGEIGRS
jgi:predicted MFS family arabinose efflux permease